VTKPALIPIEGPDKPTRAGVNGSQIKFFEKTWPMSQMRPNTPLF
jgi:hypothetical protein